MSDVMGSKYYQMCSKYDCTCIVYRWVAGPTLLKGPRCFVASASYNGSFVIFGGFDSNGLYVVVCVRVQLSVLMPMPVSVYVYVCVCVCVCGRGVSQL